MSDDIKADLLQSQDWQIQVERVWDFAQSDQPAIAQPLIEILEDDTCHPEVIDTAMQGLVERVVNLSDHNTLNAVLEQVQQSPLTLSGKRCALVLGEIGYRQGSQREPRLVPVLLQALRTSLNAGTAAVIEIMVALRECARAEPLTEAEPACRAVLQQAAQEPEPALSPIDNALEILYGIHVTVFLDELEQSLQTLPQGSAISLSFEDFLSDHPPNQDCV